MKAETVKYKETGLDWMPEVPEHWEVKRLGGLFEERKETVSENDFMPLSVTMQGIIPQLESAAKTMHVDNRKKVCIGDFAINSRSDRRGSGGLSALEGSVSIVNTVLKPSSFYLPEYTHFLLTNKLFQDEYYAKGKGIVADMWSTKFSEMKTIFLPVPPKAEQDEIVQYIKAQEEKINLFIQKKQRFIELLKEQRQSVIEAVIKKGIDPNVKFKETGIKWLGKIPNHWNICRLKDCGTYKSGDNITSEQIEPIGEYPVYGGNGLRGYFDKYTHDGDFALIGRQGALCGNINYAHGKFWASEHAVVVTLNQGIELYWFGETLKVMNLNQYSQSAAQPGISVDRIRALHMPFPPLEEQKQIVSHIKTETATIDTAIAKAEREIELIREYKEAMIAEAVMGKRNLNNFEKD